MRRNSLRSVIAAAGSAALGLGAALAALPAPAHACGGFFCSSANPVNQAAEQIIFSQNGDGTVTAVIQIMYEGPSTHFAWLLPVPGTPTIGVSSDQALTSLKQLTNPQYQLQTVFDDSCFANNAQTPAPSGGFSTGTGGAAGADGKGPSVTVVASGAVGPYDYEVINVDPSASNQAQVALDWLTTNKYDVGGIGEEVLRPYLESGLNLLAIRLQKGSSSGSIRPVIVTYESDLPSIPIRPTAVAANDDMGVMVWVLSKERAIPSSYKALELNDALIDWFNPNNNYNEVVSRAADEAMGQGFVTEYAGNVSALTSLGLSIFNPGQQAQWDAFMMTTFATPMEMIQSARANWGGFDGFEDALRQTVVLPDTISFEDFQNCTACFINDQGVTFDTSVYLQNIYKLVIKPLIDTQKLIDSRPYITRLYTTMSADEMTVDPVFDFNPDLDDVSNIHTAERHVLCSGGDPNSAPWTVEFPQGIVRGTQVGVWPIKIDDQPAALKIMQYAKTGQGKVLTDRTDEILKMLSKNGTPSTPKPSGTGGKGGTTGTGGSSSPAQGTGGRSGSGITPSMHGSAGVGGGENTTSQSMSGGGCSISQTSDSNAGAWLLMALSALLLQRRKSRA